MAKYLKNTSGATGTWVGQQIANNAYYELQPAEVMQFSYDSTVITDLGSGDLTAARDDSGNNDITDVSTGLNFLRGEHPQDTDGAPLTRTKQTSTGWSFQGRSITFETSNLTIVKNEKDEGTAWSDATVKCYNASDVEITVQATADTDAVKTVFDFEPVYDMDIIGGQMLVHTAPANDMWLYCTAVPDLTAGQGGYKEFLSGGFPLHALPAKTYFALDGRTTKRMSYNATYHTNKFRKTITHNAGEKVKVTVFWEHFKS